LHFKASLGKRLDPISINKLGVVVSTCDHSSVKAIGMSILIWGQLWVKIGDLTWKII
jgi:hypothetical protein